MILSLFVLSLLSFKSPIAPALGLPTPLAVDPGQQEINNGSVNSQILFGAPVFHESGLPRRALKKRFTGAFGGLPNRIIRRNNTESSSTFPRNAIVEGGLSLLKDGPLLKADSVRVKGDTWIYDGQFYSPHVLIVEGTLHVLPAPGPYKEHTLLPPAQDGQREIQVDGSTYMTTPREPFFGPVNQFKIYSGTFIVVEGDRCDALPQARLNDFPRVENRRKTGVRLVEVIGSSITHPSNTFPPHPFVGPTTDTNESVDASEMAQKVRNALKQPNVSMMDSNPDVIIVHGNIEHWKSPSV